MARKKKQNPESKAFRDALKSKLGMETPESAEEAIAQTWVSLEKAVTGLQEGLEALAEGADAEVKAAIGDTLDATAENMKTVTATIEQLEDLLVAEGLVEDDELLEDDVPVSQEADA